MLLDAVAQTFVRKTGTTERGREEVLILKSSARCNFDSLSGHFTQLLSSPDGRSYEDSRMENKQGGKIKFNPQIVTLADDHTGKIESTLHGFKLLKRMHAPKPKSFF